MSNTRPVMAHMIPFYPSLDTSAQVADVLISNGAKYLEIQFPYSDPTADGPAIQAACATAIDAGFRVQAGWDFVEAQTAREDAVPVFVMSYAGLVYAQGVDAFVRRAAQAGVEGLIVPDLPIDSDEGLYESGDKHGVHIVPVVALGASPERLALVESRHPAYVYAALRRGITGTRTDLGPENVTFLQAVGRSGAHVMAGFGISDPDQADAVLEHADTVVVGSAFVRAISDIVTDQGADSQQLRSSLGRVAQQLTER